MFSQTAEYALRASVTLAAEGRSLTAAEIAARCQVPTPYLVKVLQHLGRAGLVEALRGKYGGYRLGRPAADIRLLDIVQATAPLERIRRCPLGLPAHTQLCPLHRQMDEAVAQAEAALAARSVADMLGDFTQHPPRADLAAPSLPTVSALSGPACLGQVRCVDHAG